MGELAAITVLFLAVLWLVLAVLKFVGPATKRLLIKGSATDRDDQSPAD